MPNLQTIHSALATLPTGPPLVVAIVAGTTGIGSYVARAFARTFAAHGAKLRIYIIGRNASHADELIKYGRETSPGSDWRFVAAANLSLLSDVERVSKEIIRQEESDPFAGGPARLDVLYMSQALSPVVESPLTSESIDTQLSLLYYSRIAFIQHLTPLLLSCPTAAHVISIFAGSTQDSHAPDTPLPIGTPAKDVYSVTSVRKYTTFMKTFAFEHLAAQHAGKISFTHIYPGLVDGPTFYSASNPWWFKVVWKLMKPLAWWYMTAPETCGDVMVYLCTGRYVAKGQGGSQDVAVSSNGERGGGCYAVGQRGMVLWG